MLHHKRQAELWGCLYHTLYALTGDTAVLEHVRDISNARFYCRLHEMGLMAVALHKGAPAEPEFWETLNPDGAHSLLLTVPADHLQGVEHAVAVELWPGRSACISDSKQPTHQWVDWAAFLASPYGRPLSVEVLAVADLNRYPAEDAEYTLGHALIRSRDRPDPHPDLVL
ncbi:hypothetical protein E7T06_07250 [Deinococcus sp. Arct2-2]|uniref:hypothetical protein n=1 Tax=Deinococcus sp. Arct2-2 TaxID=2568653 RepID=UPI0010A4E237|nr:hypothetical protein [Deinococcus sp. Arct2-2]THF70493.1 hypothetical protein E7T06_07250 [Deinococcus sp. Arct2-2]